MKKKVINFCFDKDTTEEKLTEKLKTLALDILWNLDEGEYQLVIQKPKITSPQMRAAHKFIGQVAAELNGVGAKFIMKSILRDAYIESDWNSELVKNHIWRPVQIAMTEKISITTLKTDEVDKVAKPIMEALEKEFGIGLVFPSQLSKHLEKEAKSH